jgi:hypothetical protein
MGRVMAYDELEHMRAHPAWALLRSTHCSLVLSFLGGVFVDANRGDVASGELVSLLDDEIYALNQRLGEDRFVRPASEYLDAWASPEHGWLRKFYVAGSDEPRYGITPAVEKAIRWIDDLRQRDFIGTESRLNIIFELLRQMVFGSADDPDLQLSELRRRRAEIDAEIARVERGDLVVLESAGLRDRYQQFARTARELLSDFRELEDNFRRLDRSLRESIVGWTGSKGRLLEEALGSRESIADSDQGRSFQAFYDLLLSHQKQTELADLLERLHEIPEVAATGEQLARVHFDWIDASERAQATVRLLSEQLRRFLDDRAWLENRRVFELLKHIESKGLELRELPVKELTMELDDTAVTVGLPMERPLYRPTTATALDSSAAAAGHEDFDSSPLLQQLYVDREALADRVWACFGPHGQVGLREVVAESPIDRGLAELVGYLSLGDAGLAVTFDTDSREQIGWNDGDLDRVADVPRVTYSRPTSDLL